MDHHGILTTQALTVIEKGIIYLLTIHSKPAHRETRLLIIQDTMESFLQRSVV